MNLIRAVIAAAVLTTGVGLAVHTETSALADGTPPPQDGVSQEKVDPPLSTTTTTSTTTSTTTPPTPTTVSPPTTSPPPPPVETPAPAATGDVWAALAQCESGMTNANTGNGYYGYFQFSAATWTSVGGPGLPTDHGYETQLSFAQKLQAQSGWGQWPYCSIKIGVR